MCRSTEVVRLATQLSGLRPKVSVSPRTVGRELKRAGQYPYHRAKKPSLNDAHMAGRVAFARDYKDHDWHLTLMTDETEVSIMQTPNSKNDIVWAPKGAD